MGNPQIPAGPRTYQLSEQFVAKLKEKGQDKVIDQTDIDALAQDATASEQAYISRELGDGVKMQFCTRQGNAEPVSLNFDVNRKTTGAAPSPAPVSTPGTAPVAVPVNATGAAPASAPQNATGDASPAAGSPEPQALSMRFQQERERLTADGVLSKTDIASLRQGASAYENQILDSDARSSAVRFDDKGYLVTGDLDVSADFFKGLYRLAKDGRLSEDDIARLAREARTADERTYLQRFLSADRHVRGLHLNDAGQLTQIESVEVERRRQP